MADPAERTVIVGQVAGVFGVKGWVRVRSYTDPPGNILAYGPWLLGEHGESECRVVDGAVHGRGVIARLEGIDDRDVARKLIGATIRVPRERFERTQPQQYYWSDLLGLQVVNENGVALGRVQNLLETGANDVLVVMGERRRLVPFVPGTVVKEVDLAGGSIKVAWDEDF
jgi:16S rRNA processing protein RimM